jgi:alkylation response protein AidB-like acyl-CoA dehydrogenase
MTWRGPALDDDQRGLAAMLDALAADRAVVLDDDPEIVSGLSAELAGLGVWTVGTGESVGGGGADQATAAVAFERLGRHWPALGWAAVQAHAAVDVLSSGPGFADLVAQIHAGTAAVAVVEAASTHVHLTWHDGALTGTVDRVDVASPAPYLLVLDGPGSAFLVLPSGISTTPVRRTGLGGAITSALTVDARDGDLHRVDVDDVARGRLRLRLGAAAVAAGIMGAAVDGAIEYAAGRRQFGDALTALPAVRQSLLRQAAGTAVAIRVALAEAADEVQAWSAVREACDAAIDVAASALQSHGGYGYLTEYPAERRLRDAVSLRAAVDTQAGALTAGRVLVSLPAHPRSSLATGSEQS